MKLKNIAEKDITNIPEKITAFNVVLSGTVINKNKEVLNDWANFDEVVNAVKQQTKEIKDIKNSTLNQ